VFRWWQWYEHCPDELGICRQAQGSQFLKVDNSAELTKVLQNENEVTLQMVKPPGKIFIPANYLCKWQVDVDVGAQYQLSIKRQYFPVQEQLELTIIGEKKS